MDNKPTTNTPAKGNQTKLWILLGVIVVIIIIIIVAAQSNKTASPTTTGTQSTQTPATTASTSVPNAATTVSSPELQPANIANLQGAKVAVPGANPITTNNKVVTATGQATDNTARPMSDTAPKQTSFLDKSTLPSGLTKITIANGTFSPSTFTTTVGAPTTFSLTGGDSLSHVIAFDDTSLNAIAILVGPGQTKAITFNAPSKAGSYTFRDASPSDKPAVGTMIVK